MKNGNYSDDMIVLMLAARRNRARYMRVMFRKGARALKSRVAQWFALPTGHRVSHA